MMKFAMTVISALLAACCADAQSCNGRQATFGARVETFATNVRVAVAERPHPVRSILDAAIERAANAREHRAEARFARAEAHANKAGCNGGTTTFQTVQTFKVVQTKVPVRAAGCSGGAASFGSGWPVNPPSVPPVYDPTMHAEKMEAGPVQRVMVHRQLNKALRRGTLLPEDQAAAERVMADPKLYDKAVDASTKIIRRNHAAAPVTPAGTNAAIGDGHILQMLVDNLPAIINAIKQILALFAAADRPVEAGPEWLPMPTGPPPVMLRPALSLAC